MTGTTLVQQQFNTTIAAAVTAHLKPGGFKKNGVNYHRRLGTCVQVVNVQNGGGSDAYQKEFYINVGLAFDEICALVKLPIIENPSEQLCDSRGNRDRLEELVPNIPPRWSVSPRDDPSVTTEPLSAAIRQLKNDLDAIDGPRGYRRHRWFDRTPVRQVNAQIHCLLGEYDSALAVIGKLMQRMNRPPLDKSDWWIDHLGLQLLRDRG